MEDNILSPEMIATISGQINEDPERYKHNVKLLEEWIDCQEFLPKNYEKNLLSVFLRGSKHDVSKTKAKLVNYFVMKQKLPEVFAYQSFDAHETRILDNMYFVGMPELTPEGYRVIISGIHNDDLNLYDVSIAHRYLWMTMHYGWCNETMIAGHINIIDCKHFTLTHATKFLSPMLKKTSTLVKEVSPYRIKKTYVINAPNYVDRTASFVRMLLSDKMKQRFVVLADDSSVREQIPSNCLPREYGGTQKSLPELDGEFKRLFRARKKWYADQELVRVSGKVPDAFDTVTCTFDDDFGLQGSFRQLDID